MSSIKAVSQKLGDKEKELESQEKEAIAGKQKVLIQHYY